MDLNLIATSPDKRVYTCCFAPDDACFHGHFPKQPVLPGSLIMALSLEAIRQGFDQKNKLTIHRFTFRHFARPGCYELHITRQINKFCCKFCNAEHILAQGQITCA